MDAPKIVALAFLVTATPLVPLGAQDGPNPSAALRIARVPIHGGADDEGVPYGLWAATDSYKVSFHGAPTFVPYLGKDAPHNLPVTWHTTSVRVGRRELLRPDERPERHRHSDFRFEYRYGAVTEAYDVLVEGLEQTFVVNEDPGVRGALVVTGRLETPLRVAAVPAASGPIELRDDHGDAVVRYGAAIAFDANGRCVDVLTSVEGTTVRLRVPEQWMAGARFPVTIDPLTSNVRVHGGTAHYSPDVALNESTGRLTAVTVFAASGADFDAYGLSTTDCFRTTPRFDWVDVSASWSTDHARVAALDVPAKILIAVSRFFPHALSRRVRYHVRGASDPTLSSQTNGWGPPATSHDWRPEVGGNRPSGFGDKAAIVYQQENTAGAPFRDTANSKICARIVDVSTGTLANATHGGQLTVLAAASFDYAFATVNRRAIPWPVDSWGWVCAFQFWNARSTRPQWQVGARPILANGALPLREWIARPSASGQQQLGPTVAGGEGRYLVALSETRTSLGKLADTRGDRVTTHRLDWVLTGTARDPHPVNVLRTGTARSLRAGKAAHDRRTDSHWVIPVIDDRRAGGSGDVLLHRCGYRGISLETVTLHDATASSPVREADSAAVCYDETRQQFAVAFTANGAVGSNRPTLNALEGACYTYDPTTPPTRAGVACSPSSRIAWVGGQQIGSEFSWLNMEGVAAGRLATVALSLGTGSRTGIPGTAPGCRFLLGLSASEFLGFLPTLNGPYTRWTLPLPENLRDRTTLHFQGWHLDDTGAQFVGTRRLTVELRR